MDKKTYLTKHKISASSNFLSTFLFTYLLTLAICRGTFDPKKNIKNLIIDVIDMNKLFRCLFELSKNSYLIHKNFASHMPPILNKHYKHFSFNYASRKFQESLKGVLRQF